MLLLWVLRFFVFHLYESPKYLMGRGKDEQAVEIVHKVAAYNGRTSTLTLGRLKNAGREAAERQGLDPNEADVHIDTSAKGAVVRKLRKFDNSHVKSLFATRKLAYSTSLLIILWGECLVSNAVGGH